MTATPARNTIGQYREFSAPRALAPFFDYFWVYEGVEDHNTETFHRVLPDPDSSIMLRARWHAGAPPDAAEVQFHGPIKNPYLYHPKGTETLVAAKVKSEWLIPLLATRAGEVAGYTGPLRALDTAMADRLLTSLEAAPSWQQAMAGLSENLGQWCHDKGLDGRQKKFGLVQAAALLARRAKGAIRAGVLARTLGVSERHLFRCFQDEVGSSPKEISRRLRFLTAVTLADNAPAPDWAGIATEAGFFDQSHMIRDFKAMSALTPRAVFSERRAESSESHLSNTL